MDILFTLSLIDRLCRERKIKKGELYASVGVSAPAVSQWRTGKTAPAPESLQRIADFFGVTVDYLLTGTESPIEESQGFSSNFVLERSLAQNEKSPADTKASEAERQRVVDDYVLNCDDSAELMRIIALAAKRNTEITGK